MKSVVVCTLVVLLGASFVSAATLDGAKFHPAEGTLELWVKSYWDYNPNGTGFQHLVYWGPAEWQTELRLFFFQQQRLGPRWLVNGQVMSPGIAIEDWRGNEWRHIAVTWDQATSTSRLYLDGELANEITKWTAPQGEATIYIGTNRHGGEPFEGEIANVRLYPFAKTPQQIQNAFAEPRVSHDVLSNLRSTDSSVQMQAIRSLPEEPLDTKQAAVLVMADLLQDDSTALAVKVAIARTLGSIGPTSEPALASLITALVDPDPGLAVAAMTALRQIASDRVPFGSRGLVLRTLVEEAQTDEIVAVAVQGLAETILRDIARTRRAQGHVSREIGPGTASIARLLQEPTVDPDSIITTLSKIVHEATAHGTPEAVFAQVQEVLFPYLASLAIVFGTDSHAKRPAAMLIGRLGVTDAIIDRLLAGLDDPDPVVRRLIVESLGTTKSQPQRALVGLLQGLNDPDTAVRLAAVAAIIGLPLDSPQQVAALQGAVSDADETVRRMAITGLGTLPLDANMTASMLSTLEDEAEDLFVRRAAYRVLTELDDRNTLVLEAMPPKICMSTPPGFLAVEGTGFVLDGEPFYEISFNKFDLAQQIMAEYMPEIFTSWSAGFRREAAENALRELSAMGFRILRISGTPFHGWQLNQSFFDSDSNRHLLLTALDEVLDLCDAYGIKLVFTLGWHHVAFADAANETEKDLIADPFSRSRQLLYEYFDTVVSRYKHRDTIAMWEITNEANLRTDHHPDFPTSRQLAAFYQDVATRIRRIDPYHIIGTGDSAPRSAQVSLLHAREADLPPDWTPDSWQAQVDWLDMIHADPIDIIGIHEYYLDVPFFFADYKDMADALSKPLFVGETGPIHADRSQRGYRFAEAEQILQEILDGIVAAQIPLTLLWTYHMDRWEGTDIWDIRRGKDDAVLEQIQAANRELQQRALQE